MIYGQKVITAEEMARIEKLACSSGVSELEFMENAGKGIADAVEEYISTQGLDKTLTLLIGKGNNGGDAFAAGKHLLTSGYKITAIQFYPYSTCSPLCQKQCDVFKAAGGMILSFEQGSTRAIELEGVLLDGLVGTGFHGKAENELAAAIELANNSKLPILAIDIPSGLNGNTGEVASVAINATQTIYLGLPKLGFFIGQGWNHVGELQHVDFGLDAKFLEAAQAQAFLIDEREITSALPTLTRNRHKYQAGYVVAVAGSPGFAGAAFLSTKAALRAGAGIVRLFHAWGMDGELAAAPLEVVKEELGEDSLQRIYAESQRAKCLLIGPGMGRNKESKKLLKNLLPRIELPSVMDADALYFLAENPSWKIPSNAVLTPHRGETERLLNAHNCDEQKLHALCQNYVDEKKVTLLLKGGPSFIFHPNAAPLICLRGDPGMATAGTGDVLTGIIAALLAQGLNPQTAAAVGATLHGAAGEIAAFQKSSYGLIASDLIDFLPDAFLEFLGQ